MSDQFELVQTDHEYEVVVSVERRTKTYVAFTGYDRRGKEASTPNVESTELEKVQFVHKDLVEAIRRAGGHLQLMLPATAVGLTEEEAG